MTVPISWLLLQRHLSLKLLTNRSASTQPVTFAQATELTDPTPWLSGGELVLTTGLALVAASTADYTEYIDRLAAAEVSALGFGTGLSHEAVPLDLLAAAENRGLPVLEVPFTTPFAAVTRAVMTRLSQQEYESVLRAAEVQTRITRVALRGGVSAIVRELAAATKTSVAFVGDRLTAVHPTNHKALIAEVRAVAATTRDPNAPASISQSTPERTLTLSPVGVTGSWHGYLAMAGTGPLSNIDRVLLGHAVSLLTLELEKPVRLRAERTRLNSMAFGLLLDGRISDDNVPSYLDEAGDTSGFVRVVHVRGSALSSVLREFDSALARAGRPIFAQVDSTALTVLLRGTDTVETAKTFLAQLSPNEAKAVRAGISTAHRLLDAPRALIQARAAANLTTATERIIEFDALTGSTILASEPAREALVALAANTIPVLTAHDHAHGTALTTSLRAYLEANGQWESAAAELGVHRHTLRGRITRIEELLRCDLGQARVRAELLLSLLAWESR
ncbi:PucR family transcriptional regulator [Rhodococcus sp. ARC_M6]|uniref:PucR family transcriptional regulator n=1 Tax=Rhodococcus sp. ARC_M6 TaxID=2928852 RepID=UPI001FB30DCB|nr:PucR family transcriptional regulator [Rhodococcus sp. ARC_M6]MCJ0904505.1 PucR family transcriptional regulator [Rhodococcus sp. ARC_M6]